MAATAVRRLQRRMRHAWRAVKRQPVPAALGAVAVAGAIAFGPIGVFAHQDTRLEHFSERHTVGNQEITDPTTHDHGSGPRGGRNGS